MPSQYYAYFTDLIKQNNLPIGSVIIDTSEMEGSGGGEYPAYIIQSNRIIELTDNIGEIAYEMLDDATEEELKDSYEIEGKQYSPDVLYVYYHEFRSLNLLAESV